MTSKHSRACLNFTVVFYIFALRLIYSSQFCCQFQTSLSMNAWGEHSSLPRHYVNYGKKVLEKLPTDCETQEGELDRGVH